MKLIRFIRETQPGVTRRSEIRCGEDMLEINLAIARHEAVDGKYTVEDVPDPVTEPTQLDRVEAQVVYTALMTDTLLEV